MPAFDFESLIAEIPDHPSPGVTFKDITPLIADCAGFAAVVDAIAGHFADAHITKVIGAEARGFLVGAPVACRLGAGFVPARKPGKLPRATYSQSYELEYGSASLEMHVDAMGPGDVALVVDDLIATGGTAAACVKLAQQSGAQVAGLAFLLELVPFNAREALAQTTDAEFFSLVKVEDY